MKVIEASQLASSNGRERILIVLNSRHAQRMFADLTKILGILTMLLQHLLPLPSRKRLIFFKQCFDCETFK